MHQLPAVGVEHGEHRKVGRFCPIDADDVVSARRRSVDRCSCGGVGDSAEHPARVIDKLGQPLLAERALWHTRACFFDCRPDGWRRVVSCRRRPTALERIAALPALPLRPKPISAAWRGDQHGVAVEIRQRRHDRISPGCFWQLGGLVDHDQVKRLAADAVDVVAGEERHKSIAPCLDSAVGLVDADALLRYVVSKRLPQPAPQRPRVFVCRRNPGDTTVLLQRQRNQHAAQYRLAPAPTHRQYLDLGRISRYPHLIPAQPRQVHFGNPPP